MESVRVVLDSDQRSGNGMFPAILECSGCYDVFAVRGCGVEIFPCRADAGS